MKTIEEIVSEIPGAKIFSTLDAKNGFLQIKLDKRSSLLTTFNTPIGRYRLEDTDGYAYHLECRVHQKFFNG